MSSSKVCWMCNWYHDHEFIALFISGFLSYFDCKSHSSHLLPRTWKLFSFHTVSLQLLGKRSVQSLFAEPNQKKGTRALISLQNQAWALPWEFSVEKHLSDQSCPNQPWPLLSLKVESSGKLYGPWSSIWKKQACKWISAEPRTLQSRQRVCAEQTAALCPSLCKLSEIFT